MKDYQKWRIRELFLSYCWENDKWADLVYEKLRESEGIEMKRDKREIDYSEDIVEFMDSIRNACMKFLQLSRTTIM
ncbi:TIR domain-containing protein [Thermaerobacillus caldiproteolyticus]|uniref:Uncharacterized protein n=1 Tax=Thermaerobacillus caldiproteolyticus TaxID=247480 RepID=A0A7V9ZAA1_9BACL|nr:TIR domain-containing protein [Anoxybacillus caldiproteolyticus]MBA2876963.1 hypothetical protein [Anoxybacillus caldiproteolyticus]